MTEIEVYTMQEVADILKVTRRTVYTYVKNGRIQAVKIGRCWRVSRDSLQEFISTGA